MQYLVVSGSAVEISFFTSGQTVAERGPCWVRFRSIFYEYWYPFSLVASHTRLSILALEYQVLLFDALDILL